MQLSFFFVSPPGREAYPGDVFYLHIQDYLNVLAKVSMKNMVVDQSLLLPIIETQAGDISAYIRNKRYFYY